MNRLATIAAFIALALALIYAATRWGDDRHPLAVSELQVSHKTAGFAPPCRSHQMPQANPCDRIDCGRPDTRRLT